MGAVTEEMKDHDVRIRRGNVNVHRDQGIVERFNRSLSERLYSFQYSQEMNMKSGERSTEWVKRLPEVVSALNREKTRLTGRRPVHAIKEKVINAKSSTFSRLGKNEKRLDSSVDVRYLFAPGELEGGGRRATDPNWSLKVFDISRSIANENEPVLYYLKDGPKRGFVREELMIVPRERNSRRSEKIYQKNDRFFGFFFWIFGFLDFLGNFRIFGFLDFFGFVDFRIFWGILGFFGDFRIFRKDFLEGFFC